MNGLSTLYILLETIAGLLIFVVGYLAVILSIIICLVIADFIYESARLVRGGKSKSPSNSADYGASPELKGDTRRPEGVRHIFQH
jgi:hypothetical protein